ncbi:hypothetical protein Tco_1175364, partial [Tanacetum coccineum]
FNTSAGNPVKEILLKLNLPDHRSILTDSKEYIKMDVEHMALRPAPYGFMVIPDLMSSLEQVSSLKNKDCVVAPKGTANVQHPKLNVNSKLKCVKCNGCMLSDNHDLCVLDFINNVNARVKSKSIKKISKRKIWKPTGKVFTNIGYIWKPTSRTFTIVGNACPLNRITTTTKVPIRKPTVLDNEIPKPVIKLMFPLANLRSSKLFSGIVKFGNDHVARILGYGDYRIGNVTISRVYYLEGLGHNLFSVRQSVI